MVENQDEMDALRAKWRRAKTPTKERASRWAHTKITPELLKKLKDHCELVLIRKA